MNRASGIASPAPRPEIGVTTATWCSRFRAVIVAGADGILAGVHPDPGIALCDGPRALVAEDLRAPADTMADLSGLMGRRPSTQRELLIG